MALWLYLHFPSLQLDATYQQVNKPIPATIVVDGKRNEVVQLTQLAKAKGITIGMGLGSASSLCAELEVKPYEERIESRTLKRIAHWLYSVSADIALYPPNGLLLRVTSMLTLHKTLSCYWQALEGHLARLPFRYQYAIAYTPKAARLLAKQGINTITEDENWLLEQVKQQPLSAGELAPKIVTRLSRVGIHTFADLLTLSLTDLSKRFNIEVTNYIGHLTGNIPHHIDFYIPPEHFEHYIELYYEVVNLQFLEKPLLKLYQLLEQYLRLKDKLAAEALISLHLRECDDIQLNISAAQGEYRADKWLQLSQLSLESVQLIAPVVGITLKASRVIEKYSQRTDLFLGSQGCMSPEELASTLMAKLGKDNVKGLCIKQDDRPEIANQLCQPFSENTVPAIKHSLRPNILLPSPIALCEKVMLMPYPERVVSGWWDGHQIVRDYFIGRSEQGRWLWLFKDNKRQWFIHGVFS